MTPNLIFVPVITFLDTGEVYGINLIGTRIAGFFHGTAGGTSMQITSTDLAEYNAWDGGLLQTASLTADASSADTSLKVALTLPFGTYTGSTSGPKSYASNDSRSIYNVPIATANLAGTYTGELSSVGTAMARYTPMSGMTLSSNGNFTATSGTCTFAGSFTQHASTGVFDAIATVTGSSCLIAGEFKGIMTPVTYSSTTTNLAFQLLSADASKSAAFYLTKN